MRRDRLPMILGVVLLVIGFLIFIYPKANEYYVNQRMEETVTSYLEMVTPNESTPIERLPEPGKDSEGLFIPQKHVDLWNRMSGYNHQIWMERQAGLFDTWTYETPSFDLTECGLPDDVFGIISIPKMNLKMPLYLGANWQHMADGAAQLSQTSIPIGGNNTNSVIAGHRGWCGAAYFREIMKLEIGDKVIIQNPWQTLQYQVTEIQIIEPNDVDAIHIKEGRDMVTLLTCHPYASGGQQRYLVLCDRIFESEEEKHE